MPRRTSRQNERRFTSGEQAMAPFLEGGMLLLVGGIGLWLHQALLFTSLGATAYEQIEKPHQRSSRPYNIVVGHLIGMGSGYAGAAMVNGWSAPNVLAAGHLTSARLWAGVIAVALTTTGTLLLRAGQPAALSTSLLVAISTSKDVHFFIIVVLGVALLTIVGEPVRRWRLRMQENRHIPVRESET